VTRSIDSRPRRWTERLAAGLLMATVVLHWATAVQAEPPKELIDAAKKEGKVVVDGPPVNSVRQAFTKAFESKYGIKLSYISSGTSKSGARIRAERASGKYLLDVFISGADTPLQVFAKSGWAAPISSALVDPEVTDGSRWADGHLWYLDPDKTLLRMLRSVNPELVVNTKVVRGDEIQAWTDLLKDKYKGMIAAKDPSIGGTGSSLTAYFYLHYGPDFVSGLYKGQAPALTRDPRQIVQWVAQGTYPIAVGANQTEFQEFKSRGFPIEIVFPKDSPDIVSGGFGVLCMMNNAPNPNAAKLFVNWLASKEGQTVFSEAISFISLRTDVPHNWAPDYIVPKPGVTYIDTYDYDFIMKERSDASAKVNKLLGM
jgi:ABC-type Fe3+ transport system substrate-binding protein